MNMEWWAWLVIQIFSLVVLLYFISLNGIYLLTTLMAYRSLVRFSRKIKAIDADELISTIHPIPITLIAPAYNEEATCVESARAILALEYASYDIMIVNDGSKDRTMNRLVEAFAMHPADRMPMSELPTEEIRGLYRSKTHPKLWLLDKENGGKADALNAGINFCRSPLFCAMDSDSLLERDALSRMARPFLEDAGTVAVGGTIRIVNGCTVTKGKVAEVRLPSRWIPAFQVMEYLRAFLAGRMGWDAMNATLIISGAFGIFRRSTVVEAGGYLTDTVGEDMELVVRLHRTLSEAKRPYRIVYIPDPVAWTECPETLRVLARQRDRWQRGLMDSLARHRKMLFNPRYGSVGMVAFPYYYFLEMLGPVVEFCGYILFIALVLTGMAPMGYVIAFLAMAILFGIVISILAVALEEVSFRRYNSGRDLTRLFFLAVIENFGYRQLSVWWRFRGTISGLRGVKGWGQMDRRGFSE